VHVCVCGKGSGLKRGPPMVRAPINPQPHLSVRACVHAAAPSARHLVQRATPLHQRTVRSASHCCSRRSYISDWRSHSCCSRAALRSAGGGACARCTELTRSITLASVCAGVARIGPCLHGWVQGKQRVAHTARLGGFGELNRNAGPLLPVHRP